MQQQIESIDPYDLQNSIEAANKLASNPALLRQWLLAHLIQIAAGYDAAAVRAAAVILDHTPVELPSPEYHGAVLGSSE